MRLLLVVAVSTARCATPFGPGAAIAERPLFAAPPVVECRGERCALVWTQGEFPHAFSLEYRAMNGRLVFSQRGVTSTGSHTGRRFELPIEGVENLQALRRGGAVWWQVEPEPQGTFVPVQVVSKAD